MTSKADTREERTMIRQGDVFVIPATIPASTTEVPRDKGRVILAYGEVTGHAHAIVDAGATLHRADDATFLRIVGGPVTLGHEEHTAIVIEPGEYRVLIHREFTDELAAARVLD